MRRRRVTKADQQLTQDWHDWYSPEAKARQAARKKKHEEFNAMPMAEMVEIARWVNSVDPQLARGVMEGWISLCDAYDELKAAEVFLAKIPEVTA
jgi:hypothetical protein